MAIYEWSDNYKVGNDFIDYEHKKMFQMIDEFNTALGNNTAQDQLGVLLFSLEQYAIDHFKHEEDEMLRLDAKGFLLHKLEHTKFIRQLDAWTAKHTVGDYMFTIAVSRFLYDWLKNHILKTDQLLADAIRKDKFKATL